MSPADLSREVRRIASDLGFAACGITRPQASRTAAALDQWLAKGYHGSMKYMERQAAVRRDPRLAWPQCRSIVVVLDNYARRDSTAHGQYRVARYAQGKDYHRVMKDRLRRLGDALTSCAGSGSYRSYVDAGPIPERELAWLAGLGWVGKNTMLLNPQIGSYTFIGVLLTDLLLEPDQPFEADRCGSCTRCLEACPTGAFPEPRVLDATRCISYLTIELRGEIPDGLREPIGEWLFGCDVCQEVCPWNVKFAPDPVQRSFEHDSSRPWPELDRLQVVGEAEFSSLFGDTALTRATAQGIRRNAAVVAANRLARNAVSRQVETSASA